MFSNRPRDLVVLAGIAIEHHSKDLAVVRSMIMVLVTFSSWLQHHDAMKISIVRVTHNSSNDFVLFPICYPPRLRDYAAVSI